MTFKKGHPQYNTGKTHFKKGCKPWNTGKHLPEEMKENLRRKNKGNKPWNDGIKGIRLSKKSEFKKGFIPWNKGLKGIHLSVKSEFKKGQISIHKNKPSLKIRGENHWNWKGGITPKNTAIRMTLEYKIWARQIKERDNYTCQICGKRGGYLHADHIKKFADYPELRFELSNGRTLCVPCHRKTETYGEQKCAKHLQKS
jgi:hypothetical protein